MAEFRCYCLSCDRNSVVGHPVASTHCLHQFWPALKRKNVVSENLPKCSCNDAGKAYHGFVNGTTDLGFARSAAFGGIPTLKPSSTFSQGHLAPRPVINASVLAGPALEVVRVCVFYALLQTGVAVQPNYQKQVVSLADDLGSPPVPGWLEKMMGHDKEAEKDKNIIKLRKNWNVSTKGTLIRKYRVPSKAEGRKILNAICSLLSDDDSFVDVSTHKGCQVRRENAHAESVCCNNVRALFDELPTPHLVVEITVFPAGPITEVHYQKAEKLEKVLKKGNSI
ncbi:unnamed protein product [Sphagnum jensenii]